MDELNAPGTPAREPSLEFDQSNELRQSFTQSPRKELNIAMDYRKDAFEYRDDFNNKTPQFQKDVGVEIDESVHSFGKDYKIQRLDQKFNKVPDNNN